MLKKLYLDFILVLNDRIELEHTKLCFLVIATGYDEPFGLAEMNFL